jgi:hypothetical protein
MNPPTVGQISAPTSLNYRVTALAPYSGGASVAISSYELMFKKKNGIYTKITGCEGSETNFKTNLYCDLPLADVAAALLLDQGDEIVVNVRAINAIGEGLFSADSSSGGVFV